MADNITGSKGRDQVLLGSGSQIVDTGAGKDCIISYADAGEPGTESSTDSNDILTGGEGADTFEFRALLNATSKILAQHTNVSGRVNWTAVTGENDNWHDHWVEGFGLDTITDFSKEEGDKIVIRGHTATIKSIEYDSDAQGKFSLITVYSQQGDGGAAGANTATGAHDEDSLGQIKVYGDKVTTEDIEVIGANLGIDLLERTDAAYGDHDGGIRQFVYSNTDGISYSGILARQTDIVKIGMGSQKIDAGGGNDVIYSYSDSGEPDPAQTDGAAGRVNPALAEDVGNDILIGGQGRDKFAFRLLLNAKQEILEKHTRSDGSVNWKQVAGENDNVHDHWVEGIGNDTILDFSNQDGDKIEIRGHTVEIASITYDEDDQGDYSLITLRSQQGDNGGAHDEDSLGTIKVYGDKVTADDINLKANVFYGIDQLDIIAEGEAEPKADNEAALVSETQLSAPTFEIIEQSFEGTRRSEKFLAGSGSQTVNAGAGNDRIISYADAGEPDPAQTPGSEGRVYAPVPEGSGDDVFTGGAGRDTFEFHVLLNARPEVIEQHTNSRGHVNWGAVAGENDNVHDHWVEGIGNDTITDFSKEEGDKIVVRGHTITIDSVTYSSDDRGSYSLITIYSQQGNGGAGGANTAAGAHDEDPLGTIKVYGDKVEIDDIVVKNAGVVDGTDRLPHVDALGEYNGGTQEFISDTDGELIETAPEELKTTDFVTIGYGSQSVFAGAGNDVIHVFGDAGEPDPAQTDGPEGRANEPIASALSDDIVSGGQGKDKFTFNVLLNARDWILARHMKVDGSINWRKVAGENDAVHDHWVEGVGEDTLLDFSRQDGDQIIVRGHTVEIVSITYDVDEGGDYSLVAIRSQQGDDGGAHDEDSLGTLKIYGDKVTEEDIKVVAKGVFDGVDKLEPFEFEPYVVFGTNGGDALLEGTDNVDVIKGRGGLDLIDGKDGDDFLFGDGSDDVLLGGAGDDFLEGGRGNDSMSGGAGNDTLFSNSGSDSLSGGADSDTFIFDGSFKIAEILDFEDDSDVIDLSRLENVSSVADLTITQVTPNRAQIELINDNGESAVVDVMSSTELVLDSNDFWFG